MSSSAKNDTSTSAETKPATPDWQHRPPYLPPSSYDNNDSLSSSSSPPFSRPSFDTKLRAHCHCGRVSYRLSRDAPLASKYCHCTDCQVMHGAPFQWAAIFEKAHVAFDHGVSDLAFYDAANNKAAHGLPCKVSCAYCGSRVMDEGRNMLLLFPELIRFEGDERIKEGFKPQYVGGL